VVSNRALGAEISSHRVLRGSISVASRNAYTSSTSDGNVFLAGLDYVFGDDKEQNDNKVPAHPPIGIAFSDEDTSAGVVKGDVFIDKAIDESDVVYYVIYWAANGTAVGPPIQALPKMGDTILYQLTNPTDPTRGVLVPDGVNQLMAITSNHVGQMPTGPTCDIWDSVATEVGTIVRGMMPTSG